MNRKAADTYTFRKEERITSKKKIEELLASGSSFYFYPFSIKFLSDQSLACHQVLISVPKKFQKKAIARNRIKRLIRESYRLNKSPLLLTDKKLLISFVYISKEIHPFTFVERKLKQVLQRLAESVDPS